MNDNDLKTLLRALPRTSASPQLASDVLRAVRRPAERPRAVHSWRLATAFMFVLCVALGAHFVAAHHARQARIAALRAERQQLEAELEAVKRLADTEQPAIVLESPDGARVVVERTSATQAATPSQPTYND